MADGVPKPHIVRRHGVWTVMIGDIAVAWCSSPEVAQHFARRWHDPGNEGRQEQDGR